MFGLSRLAVWWLRLGVRIERIQPGHPELNGKHERLRLTLKIATVEYPTHDRTVTVTRCCGICMKGKKINLSTVFAGQDVGIKEVNEQIWLVLFMQYDLGYFDEDSKRFEPVENPLGPKVLPTSSE